jgi:hypothetical protein
VVKRARSIAAVTLAVGLSAASSASAAVWHASPTGTGSSPCKSSDPCSLGYAANVAPSGTEVLVAQGTYGAVTYGVNEDVYIHGSGAKPYPLVEGGVDPHIFHLIKGDHLRYLRVHQTHDYSVAIQSEAATIENVSIEGSGNPAPDLTPTVLLGGGSVLRDSVVWSNRDNAVGVRHSEGYAEIRNVTAWTRGYGGIAVSSQAGCYGGCQGSQTYTDMSNVIARGGEGGYDLSVEATGGSVLLASLNSNYRASAVQTGPGASLSDHGGNQTAVAPKLVNPAAGDFHELPGSPTTDAGASATPPGRLDLDGLSRLLGQAPDIGAFELQNPSVLTAGATGVKAHAATLAGAVDPNGKATTVRFQLGTTTAYGRRTAPVSVGPGTAPVPTSAAVKLLAGRTYHYRLVAANGDGATYGGDRTSRHRPSRSRASRSRPSR